MHQAQQIVVSNMIDGLMVIDQSGYIVEINSTARNLWKKLPVLKGHRFEGAVRDWPELASLDDEGGATTLEASRAVGGETRHFQMTLSLLRAPAGYLLGRILVFKDVTNERQQQPRTVEQERALALLTERERLGRELHDGPSQL